MDAAAAVLAGIARPLAGGTAAFTMVRGPDGVLPVGQAEARWPADLARLSARPPSWAGFTSGPLIMAILNATPDSFSDGGDHGTPARAIAAAERMLAEGADIIDIGGESTRPGADLVAPELEQARILPVIAAIVRGGAVVSVDTRNASTMARALDLGARIVNDVSALTWDQAAPQVIAGHGCPVILMHMRGTPKTMAGLASYDDVALDVTLELSARIAQAEAAGIVRTAIAVDPGFGFAKTAAHSIELLRRLALLVNLGLPIVAGLSRKNVIGHVTGEADRQRRLTGSVAAALLAFTRGARILRVHDVAETRQAVMAWRALS